MVRCLSRQSLLRFVRAFPPPEPSNQTKETTPPSGVVTAEDTAQKHREGGGLPDFYCFCCTANHRSLDLFFTPTDSRFHSRAGSVCLSVCLQLLILRRHSWVLGTFIAIHTYIQNMYVSGFGWVGTCKKRINIINETLPTSTYANKDIASQPVRPTDGPVMCNNRFPLSVWRVVLRRECVVKMGAIYATQIDTRPKLFLLRILGWWKSSSSCVVVCWIISFVDRNIYLQSRILFTVLSSDW